MRRNVLVWSGILIVMLMTVAMVSDEAWAQLTVKIETDLDSQTIQLGPTADEVFLNARSTELNVKYAWNLNGPGNVVGNLQDANILYEPPATIDVPSMQVTISISITDEQGNTATENVVLTLVSPEPTPTPTAPPTPTPMPSPTATPTPTPTATPTATPTPTPTVQPKIQHVLLKQETYSVAATEVATLIVDMSGTVSESIMLECSAIRGIAQCDGQTITYTAPKDAGVKDILTVKAVDGTTQKVIDQTVIKIKIVEAVQ